MQADQLGSPVDPVEDDELFMGFLKDLGSKIMDKGLDEIFGTASFTLADIAKAVEQEVSKVFFQQEAADALLTAAATLKTAQDFLREDYLIDKTSGMSKAELWSSLNNPTTTPNLANLETEANTLEGWIEAEHNRNGNDRSAATATTIYLAIYLHICLYHSERALVAPDDATAESERQIMRKRASDGIATMMPYVLNLIDDRLSCLNYQEGDFPSNPEDNDNGDSLTDSWFDGAGQNTVYAWDAAGSFGTAEYRFALRAVMHATSRLLSNGGKPEADALWAALESNWLKKSRSMTRDVRDDYRGLTFVSDWNFGKWASNARDLLMQLDVVATGIGGNEQDQWSYCSTCGVLYFSDAPSRCAGRNPFGTTSHLSPSSFNYVLHCDSPSPPSSGAQTEWRWCANCGVLHLPGSGASVCPAGGAHISDGSANYLLSMPPPAPLVGIATVQDNWNWCKNCGALHFGGGGASICPAAAGPLGAIGPHITAAEGKSGNYQLTSLGNALWTPPL